MIFEHKYCYLLNGIYLITDLEMDEYEPVELPFNLFNTQLNAATAYIRWSKEKQTFGHTLKIQVEEVIIKAKIEGFEVVVLFVDKAKSAFHNSAKKRKSMNSMKEYILTTNNVTAIIFFEESRTTRQIEDFVLQILAPIKQQKPNFKVFSSKTEGEWDENNPFVQYKFMQAHQESIEKSTRSFDYHKNIVINTSNPQRPEGQRPFGYSKVSKRDGTIETNGFAELVVFIYYLYSFGYSDKAIANLFNKSNIPTIFEDTKEWRDSTIRYILKNRWYIGDFVWFSRTSYHNSKKKPLEDIEPFKKNHHIPLIGPNLWTITQYFRKYKQSKAKMKTKYLLRNLVYCTVCNTELITNNSTPKNSKKDYLYYKCPVCNEKVKVEDLHKLVLNDFSTRWNRELANYKKEAIKIINTWKSELKLAIAEETGLLQELRYKFSFLTKDNEYYDELKESFELEIRDVENTKLLYTRAIEQIEQLLKYQPFDDEIVSRFKLNVQPLMLEEKRAILIMAINTISVNLSDINKSEIEYRLTPYLDIENVINSMENNSA